ncbi:MAG: amidase domain-containing protein [Chloroflexota bacterium]
MTRKIVYTLSTLFLLVSITFGGSPSTYAVELYSENSIRLEEVPSDHLQEVASAAVHHHLDILTNAEVTGSSTYALSARYEVAMTDQFDLATRRHQGLLEAGIIYSAYEIELSFGSIATEGELVTIEASEYTIIKMETVEPDPLAPTQTEYVDTHTFAFQQVNDQWHLVDLRTVQPLSIESDDPNDIVTDPPAILSFDPQASNAIYLPFAAVDPDEGIQAAAIDAITADRNKIVSFAVKWWNGAHPWFNHWPGVDCTNFVSQALYKGGWHYTPAHWWTKWDPSSWWYVHNHSYPNTRAYDDQTRSWTYAPTFYNFAVGSGRAVRKYYLSDLRTGDVLQIDWWGNRIIDHTAIVTDIGYRNRIYLTYHSINRLNKPLTDIMITYPNANYYPLQIQ